MNKVLSLFLTLIIAVVLFNTPVYAVDFFVNCDGSSVNCTKSGLEPLFSNSEVWYPGKSVTRSFTLKNSSGEIRAMALNITKTSEGSSLENVMMISISSASGPVLWAGTLTDLYLLDRVELGTFSSGAEKDFNITATMNPNAGNEYQNRMTVFTLKFGLFGVPIPGGGSGGGSGGSGGGVSTCNDPAPSGAPTLLSATVTGSNQVTLSWSKAPNPVTYYLITFGLQPGQQLYGNPNVGDSNTTAYTVQGLSGGTTYYFRVRAGNGCNAGPFSNELSVRPDGSILTTSPIGFVEGVLGSSLDNIGEGTSSSKLNDIFGIDKFDFSDKGFWQIILEYLKDLWWLLLLLLLLLLFLLWRRRHRSDNNA